MFANPKALLAAFACALVAHAQSSGPSTTSSAPASQSSLPAGLDQCIIGCISVAAASNGCGSFTNLQCVCTSSAFQAAAGSCLIANCTSSDLSAALQLQQQECGSLSTSASSAASTGASSSSSASTASSGGSSSASASPSATSSSSAMALNVPLSFGGLVGTLAASAGALVGTAFIL